ncbi:MAG TPA: hypothetical protein VHP36_08450 [Chitinispirillaceae bacterium]|nr:hypothetical protein [Chitinispirillaceae bacterium]
MRNTHQIKVENGVVRLYRQNGDLDRVICSGAVNAEIKENEIVVQMQGGKKKVYSVRGFFVKNL